jgi:hypothetical protein
VNTPTKDRCAVARFKLMLFLTPQKIVPLGTIGKIGLTCKTLAALYLFQAIQKKCTPEVPATLVNSTLSQTKRSLAGARILDNAKSGS